MKKLFLLLHLLLAISAQAEERLVLLSPHWDGVRREFEEGFQAYYQKKHQQHVNFTWLDVGGTGEIIKFIKSGFQNNKATIGVDLLFGGGTDPYEELKKLNYLEPHNLPPDVTSRIPSAIAGMPLIDPLWVAPTMSAFGVLCNQAVLDHLKLPMPTGWEDLLNPKLQSWIGVADPRKSGTMHFFFEIFLQRYGWSEGWKRLYQLAHNAREFSTHAAEVTKDVASGEVACGLSLESYAIAQIRETGDERLQFVFPKGESLINGDAIAILKGAPHQALAQEFIAFTLSDAGQRLLFYKKGIADGPKYFDISRLSVHPTLYEEQARSNNTISDVSFNPFNEPAGISYDSKLAAKRWSILNDLFSIYLINPHRELSMKLKYPEIAPLAESDLKQLIEQWTNTEFRNKQIDKWESESELSKHGLTLFSYLPLLVLAVFVIFKLVCANLS
jgi:ABC-type Fe3+ transport system substrate-binding protein